LLYHAELAEYLGAEVITLHGGGAYGDKETTLMRIENNIQQLPVSVRRKLALENDDRIYTPKDLLPVFRRTNIPLVYDVHHHKCNPDGLDIREATEACLATWNREPLFHQSSPQNGWNDSRIRCHHDFIQQGDFSACWKELRITVEVEAKAREAAVMQLQKALQRG